MPRAPILRNKVIDLLKDGPKSWEELKRLTGAKSGSLDFVLKELVRKGIARKENDDRWHLIWSGYTTLIIGERIKELLETHPRNVREYALFFMGPEEDHYLEYKLSNLFLENAENFVINAYMLYSAWLISRMSENERRRFLEAVRDVILVGCSKLGLDITREMERFKESEDQEDAYFKLSDCILAGLQLLRNDLRINPLFLTTLWDLGILGLLAKEVLEELRVESDHKGAKRRALESVDLVEKFFNSLENMKLFGVVCITPEFYQEKAHLIWRFEKWFEALRKGRLDHREYLLERCLMGRKRGRGQKESTGKLISPAELALKFANAIKGSLKSGVISQSLMNMQLDPYEPWTLGDLYWHHPRGKDPNFYEEIYMELEKMRERICRKKQMKEVKSPPVTPFMNAFAKLSEQMIFERREPKKTRKVSYEEIRKASQNLVREMEEATQQAQPSQVEPSSPDQGTSQPP